MNCATCDEAMESCRGVMVYDTNWPDQAIHDPRIVHRQCTAHLWGGNAIGRIDVRALNEKLLAVYRKRCDTKRDREALEAIWQHANGDVRAEFNHVDSPPIADDDIPF